MLSVQQLVYDAPMLLQLMSTRGVALRLGVLAFSISMLAACGGGGADLASIQPSQARVSSAKSSLCVDASTTSQMVTVPPAAGIGVTLSLAEYDARATGCQNVDVATGADASDALAAASVRAAATARAQATTSPAPIMSISLGAAAPQNSSGLLGWTTIVAGVSITTGNNVFPDGTYLATCTYSVAGVSVTNSIVFTASNGVLTITNGEVPFTANSNVQILIYNRGVVPPGYSSVVPTATPSATSSPTPSAAPTSSVAPTAPPTATPSPSPGPVPSGSSTAIPNGAVIGTSTVVVSGDQIDPSLDGKSYTTQIVYEPTEEFSPLVAYSLGSDAIVSGTATYVMQFPQAKSYTIFGCADQVTYAGNGISGTMALATVTPGLANLTNAYCSIVLWSVDASIINQSLSPTKQASLNQYLIYVINGPVGAGPGHGAYPPAQDI
jgi:hypothetical protein